MGTADSVPTAWLVSMTGRAAAQELQLKDKEHRRTTTRTQKETHRLLIFILNYIRDILIKNLNIIQPTFTCSGTRAPHSEDERAFESARRGTYLTCHSQGRRRRRMALRSFFCAYSCKQSSLRLNTYLKRRSRTRVQ